MARINLKHFDKGSDGTVGHNRRIQWDDGVLHGYYHDSCVYRYDPWTGHGWIDTAGYMTVSTLAAIKDFIRATVRQDMTFGVSFAGRRLSVQNPVTREWTTSNDGVTDADFLAPPRGPLYRPHRETLVAYVGHKRGDERGGQQYDVTTWDGVPIAVCTMAQSWRVNSYVGSRMYQVYAWANRTEYTGRSYGTGMAVVLKETARSRKSQSLHGWDPNGYPYRKARG